MQPTHPCMNYLMNTYSRKILITGGNGQLAHAIKNHARARHFVVKTCTHQELDIEDLSSIENRIHEFEPHIIINTAAYTAVDRAEQEIEAAHRANFKGTKNIALACKKNSMPLIHLSTDYIFNGTKSGAYHEEEPSQPINTYGLSKWLGEEAVREYADNAIILRVSGVFSEYGHNFFKTILRLAAEKKQLEVVSDQVTCPTYAGDIAEALFIIAHEPKGWGTYHFCSALPISWHQFAMAIIQRAQQSNTLSLAEIKPILTTNYPTLAKRPRNSVLDCEKIFKAFGILQPSWEEGIKHCQFRQINLCKLASSS
jgi:dTDP-4-dehydrorhamnose reductase